MEEAAFWVTAVVGLCYFLLRPRRFDYVALGFGSSLVYFLPLFVGYTRGTAPGETIPVQPTVYLIGAAVLACVVLAGEISARITLQSRGAGRGPPSQASRDGLALGALLAIALGGMGVVLLGAGTGVLRADKAALVDQLSRGHALMVIASVLGAVWAYRSERYGCLAWFAAILCFDVYMGFRMGAAIAFVAVVFCSLFAHGRDRLAATLWRRKKLWMFGLAGAAFFFIYKRVYVLVKEGAGGELLSRLFDTQTYWNAILRSEPFVTQSILNKVVAEGFRTDAVYLLGNVYQVLPFSASARNGAPSFNEQFQPILFPEIPGGMAGNWWAEWIAAASWLGLAVALVIYISGLIVFSWLHGRWSRSTSASALLAVAGTFWAFYIHRKEIEFFITLEKRVLGVWILVAAFVSLMYAVCGRRRGAGRGVRGEA